MTATHDNHVDMGFQPPQSEPFELVAGDSWSWKKSLSDFLYSDGWRLSYSLRGAGKLDFSAGVDTASQNHLVTVLAADTAALAAGDYNWAAYVTNGPERHQVGTGVFRVKANLAVATVDSVETRSFAKQMVDAIERVLLGRAQENDAQYTIGGQSGNRSILKLSPKELRTELGIWRWHYRQELIASGQIKANNIGVVFKGRNGSGWRLPF